jgi:outer membrane protein TolC
MKSRCIKFNKPESIKKSFRDHLSFFLTATFLFLFSFFPASAQEATLSRPLSLEQCLSIALDNNPLILSSYQKYLASQARINIAKAWPQPSLTIDYELEPKLFDTAHSGEQYFWLNQTIEFPGRLHLRKKVASLESMETEKNLEELKLSVAYDVKEAFFGLLLAEEELRYSQQNLDISRSFEGMVDLKNSTGEVPQVEVLRAKVELAKATSLVKSSENKTRIARARLNTVLGRQLSEPVEIQGELKQPALNISLEEAAEKAFSSRPEIRKVEYSILKTQTQKKQAYLSYLPDFDLGLAKHRVEGTNFWDFNLSFSIPLFFWQPKKGEIAEAEVMTRALQQEKVYWQNMVSLEVEEAYQQVQLAQEQIDLIEREILSQSQKVYDMFLYSFQEGQIGGLDLIEARRTWIEARLSYAQTLYQHAVSMAALDKALGITLRGQK